MQHHLTVDCSHSISDCTKISLAFTATFGKENDNNRRMSEEDKHDADSEAESGDEEEVTDLTNR